MNRTITGLQASKGKNYAVSPIRHAKRAGSRACRRLMPATVIGAIIRHYDHQRHNESSAI